MSNSIGHFVCLLLCKTEKNPLYISLSINQHKFKPQPNSLMIDLYAFLRRYIANVVTTVFVSGQLVILIVMQQKCNTFTNDKQVE